MNNTAQWLQVQGLALVLTPNDDGTYQFTFNDLPAETLTAETVAFLGASWWTANELLNLPAVTYTHPEYPGLEARMAFSIDIPLRAGEPVTVINIERDGPARVTVSCNAEDGGHSSCVITSDAVNDAAIFWEHVVANLPAYVGEVQVPLIAA